MNNSLTSFRFFAFFIVFLFHNLVFPVGYLGVQAFFVLSGFLLTVTLVNSKSKQTGKEYFYSFYGRRTLRIFPVYYAYLLLVGLAAAYFYFPTMHAESRAINRFYHQLPWAATYTYNIYHASDAFRHTHLLSHFWSLAIEEQFYLLWPIAIYLIPQHRIKLFLLAVIIMGPIIRWLSGLLIESDNFSWLGNDIGLIVYISPLSHFDAFATGGFFALYGRSCSGKKLLSLLLFILALGVAVSILFESRIDWLGLGYSNFMQNSYKYVWGYSLFNLFFALCLVSLRERNPQRGLMASPILIYLGLISYGMYIFHNAFIWLIPLLLPELPLMAHIALAFFCTVLISAVSYRWLEKPCLQLKDRFFKYS